MPFQKILTAGLAVFLAASTSTCASCAEPDYQAAAITQLSVIDKQIELASVQLEVLRKSDAKYDRTLKQPKLDTKTGAYWFSNRPQRLDAIREAESLVLELKRKRWTGDFNIAPVLEFKDFAVGKFGVPALLEKSLPVGDVGGPLSGSFEVGSQSAAAFLARNASPLVRHNVWANVIQVWDQGEALVQLSYPTTSGGKDLSLAVLMGIGPAEQRDGVKMELGLIFVLGTREYVSNVGKRTVFELLLANSENQEKLKNAFVSVELPEKQSRTWRDNTGGFSLDASLVDFQNAHVSLLKIDGTTIQLPLAKLSAEDKTFVEKALGAE